MLSIHAQQPGLVVHYMTKNALIRMLYLFFSSVAIAFYSSTGSAVELITEIQNPPPELSSEHSLEEESAHIRKHHLKRLDDRLTIDPKILEQTCRYESDISTKPPTKRVALTFDDGPDARSTPALLDLLHEVGLPAAFFCIGQKVAAEPALATPFAIS